MPTADRPTEENATPHTSPSREQMPFTPCHACERAIRGTRYQCQICGDVNFCRGCCDFHPSDHLLEILPCSPSDGDSPRLSSGSDLGSRVNYDLNEAPYAETDSDDPEEDDDDDDDDYRDSNSDEDQGHDSGAQNTSLSMTRGAAHLGTWSSLIAAPRPPSEAVPPIPQLNLTDRQFAKYMRTAERLWTESTAQIRELQRNGPFPIPHRRQRIDGDNEVVGRQRRSTPHRRWRPEDLERLRALKEQGTPDTEIARILDRSASAIRQQWRKLQE
ncbi:hypothetical protein F5Y01DRAFT_299565 [Xylaria sp. FL0043]|nr:hypothetical protein F5Y01DRAFT_299565 [Xylaria sp. FL0043]